MAIIISLLVISSACSVFAASTYVEDGDWKYEMTYTGEEYYIAAYNGTSERVNIPALFQTKPVTRINNNAFLNNTVLEYAHIPATVTYIGMNAFYGCSNLESVVIPDEVTEIGNNAFYGCTSLVTAEISKGTALKVIPLNCFNGCISLREVTVSQGVETISAKAFLGCSSLETIVIPPSVTVIDADAFKNCDNVTIYGWNDTYAQQYASDNSISFFSYGDYIPSDVATEPENTEPSVSESDPTESTNTVDPSGNTDPSVNTDPTDSIETGIPSDSTDPSEGTSGFKYIIGDTDLSGNVTVKDATLIQKYAAGLVILEKNQLFLANCNGQGGVNVKDATQIQKYCAGFLNILFVGTEVDL